jgi:ABC-type nitrate/sulfonate/bicarbonate transport system permease component
MSRATRWSAPALVLLGIGIVWQIVVSAGGVPSFVLPAPSDIWTAMIEERSLIAENAIPTLQIAVGGFLLALIAGVALAVGIAYSRILRIAIYPLVIGSQTVPVLALAPVLVVIFGYTVLPKLLIVALICFFPITVNVADGLRSADPELLNLLRTMGAGRARLFREVSFPSALPALFSGAKVAATFSVIGALFGEWAGSYSGLGYLMQQRQAQFDTAGLFAAVAVLTLLGIALFLAVSIAERLLIPWHHDSRDVLISGDRP